MDMKTEKIILNKNDLFITENDIQEIINSYCDDLKIKSPADLKAQQFSGLCHIIGLTLFPNRKQLKQRENIYNNNTCNCNAYDMDILNSMLDYYVILCQKYNKIVQYTDYCYLCNIPYDVVNMYIYNIHNNSKALEGNDFNNINLRVGKRLEELAKQSYFNRLSDNNNAIAQIQYGRSKGYIDIQDDARTHANINLTLSADDLPKLTRKQERLQDQNGS